MFPWRCVLLTCLLGGASVGGYACVQRSSSGSNHGAAMTMVGDTTACGQLRLWAMPIGQVDTATDRRSTDTLVTQARLDFVGTGAEYYCQREGKYPSHLHEIFSYANGVIPHRCAIPPDDTLDAWHHGVRYELREGVPMITSAGPDGRFDTSDDISLPGANDSPVRFADLTRDCSS